MRENLLFCGLQEAKKFREEGENCEELLKEFIRDELKIDREIKIDRCHRLGRYNRNNLRPRPIIAKFTYYKDKEFVKRAGQESLKNSDFWIKDQYPREMEEKRRLLYPVADEARRDESNRVSLIKDRLFINGEQYIPKVSREGRQQQQQQQQPQQQQQGRFRHRPGQQPAGNHDNYKLYSNTDTRTNIHVGSRTFYRRPGPTPRGIQQRQPDITLTNRFSSLTAETPGEQRSRNRHAGKKKANSPIDDPQTYKKLHYEESDGGNESDCDSDNSSITVQADVHMSESQASTQPPRKSLVTESQASTLRPQTADDSSRTGLSTEASRDQAGDPAGSCGQVVTSRDQADDSQQAESGLGSCDHADGPVPPPSGDQSNDA